MTNVAMSQQMTLAMMKITAVVCIPDAVSVFPPAVVKISTPTAIAISPHTMPMNKLTVKLPESVLVEVAFA